MKQLSTRTISFISLIAIVFLALGVFVIQRVYNTPLPVVENEVEQKENPKTNDETFITDVDMNIDNWQTKETEFFTIKFPKEWYWMESNREKTGYYSQVITNNPRFDIDKHAEIGLIKGGEYLTFFKDDEPESLPLSNTEIVISFNGFATSDIGVPQQVMSWVLRLSDKERSSTCIQVEDLNTQKIPLIGYCSFVTTYHEKIQTYYVINKEIVQIMTARTTDDTLAKKEILDKIVASID